MSSQHAKTALEGITEIVKNSIKIPAFQKAVGDAHLEDLEKSNRRRQILEVKEMEEAKEGKERKH